MSRKKVMGGIVVAAVLLVVSVKFSADNAPSVALSDGSTLTIESLAYGTNHLLSDRPAWRGKLRARLPEPLQGFLSGTETMVQTSTNPTVTAWLTRRNPSGDCVDPDIGTVKIFDEHGCFLSSKTAERHGSGRLIASSISLPFLSTTHSRFRMEVYTSGGKMLAAFEPRNPVSARPVANWQALPLPQTVEDGEFVFTLTEIRSLTNDTGTFFFPHIEITRGGSPVTEWAGRAFAWRDIHGNEASFWGNDGLCLREPAWKLTPRLIRSTGAIFPTNEIWSVTNVPLPAAGRTVRLGGTNTMQGVTLWPLTLAGPGIFTYSNGVLFSAQTLAPDSADLATELTVTRSGTNRMEQITSPQIHLALRTSEWPSDLYISARLIEETGSIYGMVRQRRTSEFAFFIAKVPVEVTNATLEIMVQKGVQAEFFVVPPRLSK